MKITISALAMILLNAFYLPQTSNLSIYGKWFAEDSHHQKIEMSLLENNSFNITNPEKPRDPKLNKNGTFRIEKTNNDSLLFLNF